MFCADSQRATDGPRQSASNFADGEKNSQQPGTQFCSGLVSAGQQRWLPVVNWLAIILLACSQTRVEMQDPPDTSDSAALSKVFG